MKKFTSILAVLVAVTICVGAMTACTGSNDEETKKPSSSTSDKNDTKPESDKNEGTTKPEDTKPEDTKPEDTKPEGDTNDGENGDDTTEDGSGDQTESTPGSDENAG